MYKQRSKRARRIQFFMTYTLVPILVTALVVVTTSYMIGYRFNPKEQTIEQGGLLQLDSVPGSATVEVNGNRLSSRTSTRQDMTAGVHTVTMTRDGYHPWQKTITIEAGKILWLNYTRLIPKDMPTTDLYTYDKIDGSLAHAKESRLAILPDAAKPEIDVIAADNGSAPRTHLQIPEAILPPLAEGEQAVYHLRAWDDTARLLLVTRTVGDAVQWLSIDTQAPEQSRNLSTIAGQTIGAVQFDRTDRGRAYIVSNNELRRVTLGDATISAPLVQNVASIRQSKEGVVTYVSMYDEAKQQQAVGYYTPGAARGRVLQQIDGAQAPLDAQIVEYARKQYVAVLAGANLTIQTASLHPSDGRQPIDTSTLATVSLVDGADSVEFSPNARFVVARKAATLTTYDLELDRRSTVTLPSEAAVQPLRWLDNYHLYTTVDGELRWVEFDGENARGIMPATSSSEMVLSSSGRRAYTIQPRDDKVVVMYGQLVR